MVRRLLDSWDWNPNKFIFRSGYNFWNLNDFCTSCWTWVADKV